MIVTHQRVFLREERRRRRPRLRGLLPLGERLAVLAPQLRQRLLQPLVGVRRLGQRRTVPRRRRRRLLAALPRPGVG